jgi:hypothetical protein
MDDAGVVSCSVRLEVEVGMSLLLILVAEREWE